MAELKIKADSGGGTVSLKGPATTNSNAAVNVTLPKASIDLSSAGSDGQFLKTDGAGTLSFATVSTPITALNNATANELVTVGSTTTELDAESGLTFDGTHLSITDGDLKIATAGHGIDFSATADGTGSSQAEVLKDYEEGAWTPTISSGGTAISGSNNRYVRVGGLVYLSYNLESITNEDSGALTLQGMPFTPANGGKGPCASHSIDSGHSGYITAYCDTSGNLRFLESDTNNANWANISGDEVQPGYLAFTLTYYTTI